MKTTPQSEQLAAFRAACAQRQRELHVTEERVVANLARHAADLELVCACLSDDLMAWRALSEEMLTAIAIRGALRSANEEIVSEVQQATFMLLRREPSPLHGYSGVSPLRSWLRVLIQRVSITHWRSEYRHRQHLSPQDLGSAPESEGENGACRRSLDPEKGFARQELVQRIRSAANLLPRERQALTLHHRGRTLQEIAKGLALRDHNQAHRLLERARSKVALGCKGFSLRSLFSEPRLFLSLLFSSSGDDNDE